MGIQPPVPLPFQLPCVSKMNKELFLLLNLPPSLKVAACHDVIELLPSFFMLPENLIEAG